MANRQFRGDGIEAVVTTEKDLVNLCEEPGHPLAPLPLYWLRIGVQIDREGRISGCGFAVPAVTTLTRALQYPARRLLGDRPLSTQDDGFIHLQAE